MKLIAFLTLICMFSCSQTKVSPDDYVRKYITDSLVPLMNDPKSFELVSLDADTVYGHEYIAVINKVYNDSTGINRNSYMEKHREIDSLMEIPGYQDSLLNVRYKLKYRAKNKFGALVLKDELLIYNPHNSAIEAIRVN